MASFKLPSSTSFRSQLLGDRFTATARSNAPSSNKMVINIKAVGVGGGSGSGSGSGARKYKGTQMREMYLTEMIEKKVMEAKQVCEGDEISDECRVAWDEVEEFSQARAHLRMKLELEKRDPLEAFCRDNPETDECRIYED